MHYPIIDPIIVSLGPLAIRWYGLSYLAAFVTAYWLLVWRTRHRPAGFSEQDVSDLVFYGALGAVIGGRLGSMLFYNFDHFLADPLYLLRIWEGGMSFHGGLLGAIAGLWWFGRKTGRGFFTVTDFTAPAVPTGLGFGRLGNFANTELPGRVTESPLGLHYPCDAVQGLTFTCTGEWESVARHVSPLYQAMAEGVVLFIIVWLVANKPRPAAVVSGTFLAGYGALRVVTEYFRSPDPWIGYLAGDWLTMGQVLSLPMVAAGAILVLWGRRWVSTTAA
ncbi:MAG: prolipoprotein diacylglyceryl transferase [Pseudomonadales bacterium]|nr:prolipoprotein diacylglyceryl transferase [Pseudomonadales bacterium]MCP5183377.1 prolipoprotein diacylglyceryl transferase [Pseudomonadales bacterium]